MLVLMCLLTCLCLPVRGWNNAYDGDLLLDCPSGHYINGVRSQHDNFYKDRRYLWRCRYSEELGVEQKCNWSEFVSALDAPLKYYCPGVGSVLAGLKSKHDNEKEDRRWSFKCCKAKLPTTCRSLNHKWTNYVNTPGGYMTWATPLFVVAVQSEPHNTYEDRIWKFQVANMNCNHACDVPNPCKNDGVCRPSGPSDYHCDCPGRWWGKNCTICGGKSRLVSSQVVGPSGTRTMTLPTITENCIPGKEAPQYVVLMRRQDGSVDFYRRWAEYKKGFGDLEGEFWLGNENLHFLTNNGSKYGLRVDLKSFSGVHAFAEYSSFSLGPESDKYRLRLGKYKRGNAGDSLSYSNGMRFSTLDKDNDLSASKCTSLYHGAWWYNACFAAQLTGPYSRVPKVKYAQGVIWRLFVGDYKSLQFAEMKLYMI